jgi:hypothetical protein
MPKLLQLFPKLYPHTELTPEPHTGPVYQLVFIQINEAHSDKWPTGFDDHPPVHGDFQERMDKAQSFAESFPYDVYVDTWEDAYENTYHAWPDQFCLIDTHTGSIMDKSRYDVSTAHLVNDYADMLNNVLD